MLFQSLRIAFPILKRGTRPAPRIRPGSEIWASPLLGTVNGVLTGLTGSFVVPGALYLQSLALPRDQLVQATGVLFTCSTVALALALAVEGRLPGQIGVASMLAVLPALFGIVLGRRIRAHFSEAAFKQVFFAALIALGAYVRVGAIAVRDWSPPRPRAAQKRNNMLHCSRRTGPCDPRKFRTLRKPWEEQPSTKAVVLNGDRTEAQMRDPDIRAGTNSHIIDALVGAAAGAAAVWVMDRVDWFNFEHEDERARKRTQAVRPGGMDPGHTAANAHAEGLGYDLEPEEHNAVGLATHYSIGIVPGALYAILRKKVPGLNAGRGTAFGLGLFFLQDEGLNALAGLSAKPTEYPWQAHARGLVAHAVYGLVLDAAFEIAMGSAERIEMSGTAASVAKQGAVAARAGLGGTT